MERRAIELIKKILDDFGPYAPRILRGNLRDHLDTIWVRPSMFKLGFNKNVLKYISWETYLDTRKLVDEGIENLEQLPLYHALLRYYSEKPHERLTFEQDLRGLNTSKPEVITTDWFRRHIELFCSIKNEGYHPERRKIPVTVRILDEGELWLTDGKLTVSILIYLGRDEPIEAKVNTRLGGWINLKNQLYRIYGKKLLYQPNNHPDFADWMVNRPESHRWETVEKALKAVNGLRIADVGCCTGWFSIELAKKGAYVTGLEIHKTRIKAAKLFARFEGLSEDNPLFLRESFEENFKKHKYDICLVLSVLHWYLQKSPEKFYKAARLISKSCDKMILEMGINSIPIRWSPELFTKHSEYTKYTLLYDGLTYLSI